MLPTRALPVSKDQVAAPSTWTEKLLIAGAALIPGLGVSTSRYSLVAARGQAARIKIDWIIATNAAG